MNNPFVEIEARLSNIENLILDLKYPIEKRDKTENDLLTIKQAAELLNLSVPTIYGYVHRTEIPVCKRAGTKRLIFSKQELIEWVKAGRKKTIQEIAENSEQLLTKRKGAKNG